VASAVAIVGVIVVIPWEPRVRRVKLLVAVSTHLERVEQRQAIRGTWKRALANLSEEVDVIFFSGEKPCRLDPQWRRTESGCRPWNVFVPVGVNENVAVRPFRAVTTDRDRTNDAPAAAGITFVLKFPVTIAQLGIARRALEAFRPLSGNVTVELLNIRNGELQAEANFSRKDLDGGHSGDDGFFYKQVDAETYQKGFEGLLRVRPESGAPEVKFSCSVVWNRLFGEDGLVIFTGVYSADGGHYVPLEATSNLIWLCYAFSTFSSQRCPLTKFWMRKSTQKNRESLMFGCVDLDGRVVAVIAAMPQGSNKSDRAHKQQTWLVFQRSKVI
jgi:hypothetical protein